MGMESGDKAFKFVHLDTLERTYDLTVTDGDPFLSDEQLPAQSAWADPSWTAPPPTSAREAEALEPRARPLDRRGIWTAGGVALSILLASTALIFEVSRGTAVSQSNTNPMPLITVATDTSIEDKDLCERIGPLLRKGVAINQGFVALGDPGTPKRDNGILEFHRLIEWWSSRVQAVLNQEPLPSRYLVRALQAEVDFKRLYASNLHPGPELPTDALAWNLASIAHGGPDDVCHALGVKW